MVLVLYLSICLCEYLIQKTTAFRDEDWYSVDKVPGIEGWVELRDHKRSVKLNLTHQYMAFMNQSLMFQFPFYGEDFTDLKITTQGFISLSDVISSTQYIAPLMANFKPLPATNPTQDIRLLYSSDSVIIQWGKMLLESQSSAGQFDFQLRLDVTGTIYMLYKTVPLPIEDIDMNDHQVTAGISGGHAEGKTTPIPYDTISLTNVTSNSTYILKPIATCLDQKNCSSCTNWSGMCYWCPSLQQCSTGQDRLKDKWLKANCLASATKECSGSATPQSFGTSPTTHPFSTFSMSHSPVKEQPTHPSTPPSHTTVKQPVPPGQNTTTINNNTDIIDNTKAGVGTTAPQPEHTTHVPTNNPVSLPVIYVILIVASSLSFILVVSAFIILLWHKRRLNLHSTSLTSRSQPETNNLLSNGGANGHGVKCLSDGLSHI
ncbi:plexin domain-containing protein 1-like [Bolinopsis microptera]|uniref:plexin domain-containing protein 1-like n=1 Tax=Bolinopsis microptera TaxID=2820187 RepID=UPI00307B00B0